MGDDIVARLRACWCHDAFRDRGRVDPVCDHDGLRSEAADEIERLRLTCHYLAGWISYREDDIDPKQVVQTAYDKAATYG